MLLWGRFLSWLLAAFICLSLAGPAVAQTGGEVDYEYDDLGRLNKVIYKDDVGSTISTFIYSYDPAGNRTTQVVDSAFDSIPQANDDTIDAFEDLPLNFDPLANDTVEPGRTLTIESATNGSNGIVAVAPDNLSLTYTPDPGYVGPDSFTYRVEDTVHTSSPGTVDVTVTGIVAFDIAADRSAAEGDNLVFTVTKSATSSVAITLDAATSNGTALAGSDYTAVSQQLNFAPAELSKTVTVVSLENTIFENDETFTLAISNPSTGGELGANNSRSGTITNDDTPPSFAIADASASEGGIITFTVTKTGATDLAHDVDYATASGSATQGTDYTLASGTLSFASGDSTKTFTVTTSQDSVYEGLETFAANLTAASGANGATISDANATGSINEDDAAPTFSVNDVSVAEGGNLAFIISISGATALDHEVNYATSDGTALSGSDYTAVVPGTLNFVSGGVTVQQVNVATTGDVVLEPDETVNLDLTAAINARGASISDNLGLGTILNDDVAPEFAIVIANATEGSDVVFTVLLGEAAGETVSIDYATSIEAGDTASVGDFTATSGTLTFLVGGGLSQTFPVPTTVDGTYENDEMFTATLTNPVGGNTTIGTGVAAGTINNDDAGPIFSIDDAVISEGGNLTFTVTKTGSTALSHNVTYATDTGSGVAIAGTDYTAIPATVLTFTSAQTSKTITVTSIEDVLDEFSEAFFVNLSNETNGATISDSQGQGVIVDDDPGPSFAINDVSATEGGSITFTVTKTGATGKSHSVDYATAHNSTEPEDFTPASGTLSFAAADTTKTISITTLQDPAFEWQEQFWVNLTNATNTATITDNQGQGQINNDDTPPVFSINDLSASEGNGITFTVTKTGATDVQHQVSYATANGSATAGSDYTAVGLTVLTFAAADTSKPVNVTTLQDTVYEGNETFDVNLSNATSNATISDSQGVGTINEDDTAPSFSINDVSVTEGGNLVFTVTKTGSTALTHNVSYATANGTATTANNDYTAVGTTVLSFTSAQASRTLSVSTTADAVGEGDETLFVNLTSPTNGASISDSQGQGIILNDDNRPPNAVNDSGPNAAAGGSRTVFVLLNDTDPDGDSLIVSAVAQPSRGTASITNAGQTVTWMDDVGNPNGGTVNITYTASDGKGGTDTAVLSLPIDEECCF